MENVNDARATALRQRRGVAKWGSVMLLVAQAFPIIVALVGFGIFDIAFPGKLTAGKIFTSFTWFQILQAPMMVLPWQVSMLGQFLASVKRTETFLLAPDRKQGAKPPEFPADSESMGE